MIILSFGILLTFSTQSGIEAQCSYHVKGPSGTFHSPNYPRDYPPFADCNWTISVSAGHVINLEFVTFQIADYDPCEFDKVLIRDGPDCLAPTKAILCGNRIPAPFISSGSTLYVQFLSSAFASAKGFMATFTEIPIQPVSTVAPSTCEYTIYSENGTIQTPNYPQHYPANIECSWRIIVPFSPRIELSFGEFFLLSDCFLAHVDVYDGFDCSARLLRQCGLKIPENIQSRGSNMTVVFRSSGPVAFGGFKATFVGINTTDTLANDSTPMITHNVRMMLLLSTFIFVKQEG